MYAIYRYKRTLTSTQCLPHKGRVLEEKFKYDFALLPVFHEIAFYGYVWVKEGEMAKGVSSG
jgi:hypothetical protein